jgi:hypothetical protein
MTVEDEDPARSKNEVATGKTETEILHFMPMEQTIGDPASIESSLKMGEQRKNCIAASKATSKKEKGVPVKKALVTLALPTNLKAVRAEVGYGATRTTSLVTVT